MRRPRVLKRSSRDISEYDAFRTLEHSSGLINLSQVCTSKIELAPFDLIRLFGTQDQYPYGFDSTGSFRFMDTNMDVIELVEHA